MAAKSCKLVDCCSLAKLVITSAATFLFILGVVVPSSNTTLPSALRGFA